MVNHHYLNDILEIVDGLKKERSNLKNKKILLVGANGFLGKYFVKVFEEIIEGKKISFSVDCYDNHISSKKSEFKLLSKNKNIKFFNEDINNIKLKKDYNIIIYLAGIASPFIYKKFPLETLSVSYLGVQNLLEKAKKAKSKFIFFSSSEIYGNPDTRNIPTTEDYEGRVSSLGDRSCYDESKRSGETYTWIFNDFYGVKTSIIRPFNFYGNGMKKNDKRVIPQFFNTAINKNKILPFGNGKQTRSYCHIIDAIPQIINVSFFGKSLVYNIGNPNEELSANNLAMIIKRILNLKNIKITPTSYPKSYPANEPLRRCPSILKLKKEFNYKPSINIEKGLLLFAQYAKGKF